MSCDPYRSNTVLLLHFNGANGSTTFTDSSPSPKTITRSGDAQISTAQSAFGSSSLYLDGAGDRLTAPSTLLSSIGNKLSIEAVLRLSSYTTYSSPIFGQDGSAGSTEQMFAINSAGKLQYYRASGLANPIHLVGATTIPLDTWTEVELSLDGTTARLFVNGVLDASVAHTAGWVAASQPLTIGYQGVPAYPAYASHFHGHFDEIRVTSLARHVSGYVMASSEYSDSQCTLFGVVGTPGAYQERTVRAYREDTGALLGSATSSAVDGTYSIPVAHDGECVVTATHPTSHPLIHSRVIPV